MEDWIAENLDKARALAAEGLCDRCLGRMFGKVGTGMTNDQRGRMIREALEETGEPVSAADLCPLCEDVFSLMPRFAENVAEAVNEVESENFLVGSRVEPEIVEREKALWEKYGLEKPEPIKSELNREIGKLALPLIHRPVEFKNPQVVALVDTRFGDVKLDIAPIFIAGRYNKFSREIHLALQGVPRQGLPPLPRQGEDVRDLRAGDHRRHRARDGRGQGALLPRHG